MESRRAEVTRLLSSIRDGSEGAVEELWRVVYEELRELARSKVRREAANATLQPTMLVNEAYMRLVRSESERWENRAHFFGAAAEAMRRVLIDRARQHRAAKRTDGRERVSLDELDAVAAESADELLALEEALRKFEARNPRQARVVKMRFFAGLTNEEAAEALGVSRGTVVNDWRFAKAWLQREIDVSRARGDEPGDGEGTRESRG